MGLIDEYIAHGWSLAPIRRGTKNPSLTLWNMPSHALKRESDLVATHPGVGLMHAYSGTASLDVDDWYRTRTLFTARGIDLDALFTAPDAVQIVSGKPGRGKLLYQMPFRIVLPTKRFVEEIPGNDGAKSKRVTVFELRGGNVEGTTDQCLLPPTLHPDTGLPYRWGGRGDWRNLPWLPPSLLKLWEESIVDIQQPLNGGIDSSWEEIEEAIGFIDPACPRDEWIRVGMALQLAGEQTRNPDHAFTLWDEWSKGAAKEPCAKYHPGEMRGQWHSFRTSKNTTVTLGTLFRYAREGGWPGKRVDASTMFGPTDQPAPPTDIMSLLRPDAPSIDLDLFPDVLARRAREVSSIVGCDPLVPLWAGLAAVCGAIDARTRLECQPGFKVPPVLWLMTIGDPGDKKSPGAGPMIDPLTEIEASDKARFARDAQEWDVKFAVHAAAKAVCLKYLQSSEGLLDPAAAPPHPGEEPARPIALKITVSDVTSQRLIQLAADRPRGLLCYLDEMNGWIGKMTNRMSGDDRSSWVVSYEAKQYQMDRAHTKETINCSNLAVAIYGNCQPRVLEDNFNSLTQDGLLQRFVPAILRHNQTRLSQPVPDMLTSAGEWENLLRQTYALAPMNYRLSPEAYTRFRAFEEWYEDRKAKERLVNASMTYMTAFGKLVGLVGRVSLIFHAMEQPFSVEVPASVVERAIRFVQSYVIPAYRYLYDKDETSSTSFDLWVMDRVIQYADQSGMTMSEIKRGARRQWEANGVKNLREQDQWIINAMDLLETKGWVKRLDDGSQEGRGVAEWLINPYLQSTFAAHRRAVIQAKVERDHIRMIASGVAETRETSVYGHEILDEV